MMSKKKKLTLLEKHGRFGANLSVPFTTNEILCSLQKLLKFKSRSAVISYLANKFVAELNQEDKEKDLKDFVKEKYNYWISPEEEFLKNLKALKEVSDE